MAMADLDIHEPGDLAEAFALLHAPDGAARPMGGGTALMLMMKAQLFKPAALVSLRSGAAGLEAFRVSQKSSEQRAGSADAAAGAAEGRV